MVGQVAHGVIQIHMEQNHLLWIERGNPLGPHRLRVSAMPLTLRNIEVYENFR